MDLDHLDLDKNDYIIEPRPKKRFNVPGLIWLLFSMSMIGIALAFNEQSELIIILCAFAILSEILRNADDLTLKDWPELGDGLLFTIALAPLVFLAGGANSNLIFYQNEVEKTIARVLFGITILIIQCLLLLQGPFNDWQWALTLYLAPFAHVIPRVFSGIILNTLFNDSES